jgi:hypothetical protein
MNGGRLGFRISSNRKSLNSEAGLGILNNAPKTIRYAACKRRLESWTL